MTKWHRNGEHPYGMVRWSDPTGNRMATQRPKGCGVGEINDLVKLLDEYQLEVPEHFRKTWEFDTIEQADAFKAECEAKGMKIDGHPYKEAKKDADGNKIKGEFVPVLNENGKLQIQYCPVGEMVVRCVEQAAKMMQSPVFITGEYLTGRNWAECH